ncbi:MAG TPA: hypothetical protein DCG00_06160 [Alistipes sp.]|nr:hypothetical protein [Alistipes sp.]
MQPKRRNGTSASKRGDTKQVSAHAPGSTAVFPTAAAAASSLIQPLPNADGHNGHQLTPGSMAGGGTPPAPYSGRYSAYKDDIRKPRSGFRLRIRLPDTARDD